MKIKFTLLLILNSFFLCILTVSCNKESRWDCIKRSGKTSIEIRTLPPFTKIVLQDNVDVFIKQGTTQEVKIEAGDNLISLIKTKVDSGTLHIENANKCNWARSYKKGTINVYITMPTLRFVWHFGSGFLKAPDTIACDTLDIWAHQSGDADLTVNANVIFVNMHTTADLTLTGKSPIMGIWHVGEGYLDCKKLYANHVWTHSKSSGNEYLNVQDYLFATIDWIGNINYTGNPTTELKGIGSGKLTKQN